MGRNTYILGRIPSVLIYQPRIKDGWNSFVSSNDETFTYDLSMVRLGHPMKPTLINHIIHVNCFIYTSHNIIGLLIKQVEQPVSIDLTAVSKDLAQLSSSGNIQTLTQQAVAAGSVMNRDANANGTSAFSKNESIAVSKLINDDFISNFISNLQIVIKQFPNIFRLELRSCWQ